MSPLTTFFSPNILYIPFYSKLMAIAGRVAYGRELYGHDASRCTFDTPSMSPPADQFARF